jgi:membrane-associated protease RseP (regulator of RpoE activity)
VDHLPLPENSLYTYIGIGLNGEIYGNICRQDLLKLGQYDLFEPLVTFPDEAAIAGKISLDDRHGSLGAETLKRFTVIFDYKKGEMILKPNAYFKNDFKYNLSGMDVITPVPGIPYYEITKVRHGSPAWTAGLEEGDQILAINGIDTKNYTLARLINILQSKPGRKLTIKVKREEEYLGAKFRLKDPIN